MSLVESSIWLRDVPSDEHLDAWLQLQNSRAICGLYFYFWIRRSSGINAAWGPVKDRQRGICYSPTKYCLEIPWLCLGEWASLSFSEISKRAEVEQGGWKSYRHIPALEADHAVVQLGLVQLGSVQWLTAVKAFHFWSIDRHRGSDRRVRGWPLYKDAIRSSYHWQLHLVPFAILFLPLWLRLSCQIALYQLRWLSKSRPVKLAILVVCWTK